MGWTLAILCSATFCQREVKSRPKFYFRDGTKYFLFILQFCQTNLKSYYILCSGTFCQRKVKSRSILKFHFKDGTRYPLLRTFIKEHKVKVKFHFDTTLAISFSQQNQNQSCSSMKTFRFEIYNEISQLLSQLFNTTLAIIYLGQRIKLKPNQNQLD